MNVPDPRPMHEEVLHEQKVARCGHDEAEKRVFARKTRNQGERLLTRLDDEKKYHHKTTMRLVLDVLTWLIEIRVAETGYYGDRPLENWEKD